MECLIQYTLKAYNLLVRSCLKDTLFVVDEDTSSRSIKRTRGSWTILHVCEHRCTIDTEPMMTEGETRSRVSVNSSMGQSKSVQSSSSVGDSII